jgi:hypothetical protein
VRERERETKRRDSERKWGERGRHGMGLERG